MDRVDTTTITWKNENFVRKSYNGFSILVRESDNFINATKLCHEICIKEGKRTKEFYHLKKSPQFIDYVDYIKNKNSSYQTINLYYDLGSKALNDIRGYYIHKELINCVITLTSIKYLDIIGNNIMDLVNDRMHAKQIEAEQNYIEVISNLQSEIEILKYNMNDIKSTSIYEAKCNMGINEKIKDLNEEIKEYVCQNMRVSTKDLIKQIEEKFGIKKTYSSIAHLKSRYHLKTGENTTDLEQRNFYKQVKEYIIENSELSNEELLENVNTKYNLNYDMKKFINFKSKAKSYDNIRGELSKNINKYIEEHWNDSNDEIINYIQNTYSKDISKSAINKRRVYITQLNSDLKTEIQLRTERYQIIKDFIKNNIDLDRKSLLELIKEKFDNKYNMKTLINNIQLILSN